MSEFRHIISQQKLLDQYEAVQTFETYQKSGESLYLAMQLSNAKCAELFARLESKQSFEEDVLVQSYQNLSETVGEGMAKLRMMKNKECTRVSKEKPKVSVELFVTQLNKERPDPAITIEKNVMAFEHGVEKAARYREMLFNLANPPHLESASHQPQVAHYKTLKSCEKTQIVGLTFCVATLAFVVQRYAIPFFI